MTSKTTRLRGGMLLAISIAMTPCAAFATPAAPKPASLSDSLTGPAKEALNSAEILMNNNDFARAFAKYQDAYELSKDPRLLFNMAVCARSLQQYALMQSLLTRYEHDAGPALTKEDRADVDAALTAIRNLVGTLRVTASEDGAAIAIDGRDAGVTPLAAPLAMDLGDHKVTLTKAGFITFEQAVTIQGGGETTVTATLAVERHVGQLVVSAGHGATIVVDGATVAKERFDGPLASGPHDVEVTGPGKVAYHAHVDLHDGETRTVQVSLESEKHAGAPLWPWIVGGVAVAAGAAAGVYLLSRSTETQAPLEGSLGTVRFTSWSAR